MHHLILGGIVAGTVLTKSSGYKLRPFARRVVKTGLRVTQKVRGFGRGLRNEADSLFAEAKAELDAESRGGQAQ